MIKTVLLISGINKKNIRHLICDKKGIFIFGVRWPLTGCIVTQLSKIFDSDVRTHQLEPRTFPLVQRLVWESGSSLVPNYFAWPMRCGGGEWCQENFEIWKYERKGKGGPEFEYTFESIFHRKKYFFRNCLEWRTSFFPVIRIRTKIMNTLDAGPSSAQPLLVDNQVSDLRSTLTGTEFVFGGSWSWGP